MNDFTHQDADFNLPSLFFGGFKQLRFITLSLSTHSLSFGYIFFHGHSESQLTTEQTSESRGKTESRDGCQGQFLPSDSMKKFPTWKFSEHWDQPEKKTLQHGENPQKERGLTHMFFLNKIGCPLGNVGIFSVKKLMYINRYRYNFKISIYIYNMYSDWEFRCKTHLFPSDVWCPGRSCTVTLFCLSSSNRWSKVPRTPPENPTENYRHLWWQLFGEIPMRFMFEEWLLPT